MANDTLANQILQACASGIMQSLLQNITGSQGGLRQVCIPIPALADLANSQVVEVTPGFAGTIVTNEVVVGFSPATTASKLATLTASTNAGTTTTGGAVAITSANMTPAGNVVAGTAITATNTFTASQTCGCKVSAVTTFVEGKAQYNNWVKVQ